jgi:hypothetical protein
MEPEQPPIEGTEKRAEEKPESSANTDNRRGRDSGRPRFRRDDRSRRGDRGDRGERPRTGGDGGGRPPGSVRDAIQHVEHIKADLRKVLDEMHEVVRILEQAEREKTASEEEIEKLRESLGQLQDRGRGRFSRSPEPRQAPVKDIEPTEEEPERGID